MRAGFVSPLAVRELDEVSNSGRGLWEVCTPLKYKSALTGKDYTVPIGFKTDFASVPRWFNAPWYLLPFKPIVDIALMWAWYFVGDTARSAATLHDWLYTSHPTDRLTADKLLKEATIATGWPVWKAWVLFIGVRIGGASHWN